MEGEKGEEGHQGGGIVGLAIGSVGKFPDGPQSNGPVWAEQSCAKGLVGTCLK